MRLAEQLRSGTLGQGAGESAGDLVREPVQVGEMIQTIEKQLKAHDQALGQKERDLTRHVNTNQSRHRDAASLTSDQATGSETGAGGVTGSGNAADLAGAGAGAAAAAASGGGAGAGGAATRATGGGAEQIYRQAAGSDYSGTAGTLARQGAVRAPEEPGSKIEIAATGSGADDLDLPRSSSGSSSATDSLREALRARLGGGAADFGETETDLAESGGEVGIRGANGEPGTGRDASGRALASDFGPGGNASFGGLSSAQGFSLSGSETDAYVQGMVGKLRAEMDGGRLYSSSLDEAPEILSADSESLFRRTRDTHMRSVEKGLVFVADAGSGR
jgi:hypothetical protein